MICDDAYAGKGTCKISALLLLDSLVTLGNREGSRYVIDAFGRLNFIGVIVDSIKSIPYELRNTNHSDIPALLAFYTALLALLLRISQTRLGATHVVNAGLFPAIRTSQIFSADPDIGLEIENTQALEKFFRLMLSLLRVINAVVVSRGTQNDQTLTQAREFLQENRGCAVSVFKRNAGIGGKVEGNREELNELVDQFTLLVSATGFMESEEKKFEERDRNVFS
ncbi:hypothetical protein LTS18_010810 [Coniosporium uncinatum]|uniref:Uncharacterized protein n=1 Tax=Coniosporium uncinatum TaxID=93489 RepID=A0ACC3CZK6_9PEZI|nr:hypothetical protein LTS18_010810 [Coniosporium uncinatum]